jgi:CheY-like chemotaxis protein
LVVSVLAANDADVAVVLVVEDDILVRFDIASSLQDAGYVVVEAGSGEDTIALCNSGTSIDMVFTDLNLGGAVSGWEVAQCCRTVQPDVPVIYTSGKSIERWRCVPGSAFVAKPYRNSDVLSLCQRLIARH